MNPAQDAVTLTVDGLDYGGWKSVEISADLERQFRSFSLNITWQWPGQLEVKPIKPGSRCQVRIGSDLVLTGYVYKAPVSYDAHQVSLSIEGSSLTQDLADCAAINRPSQWQEQSLLSIVQALAGAYGGRGQRDPADRQAWQAQHRARGDGVPVHRPVADPVPGVLHR